LVPLLLLLVPLQGADDGLLFLRNLSETPALHTEHAGIDVMPLYAPAQNTQGVLVEIEYLVGDKDSPTVAYTRSEAKPLVATFLDGEVEFIGDLMFTGHGRRDAFATLSLDDGATWKTQNLSESSHRSSFRLADGTRYPGDVIGISSVVVGNRVFVAWQSRFCEDGDPLHAWLDEVKDGFLAAYPELDRPVPVVGQTEAYQLYVDDLFGVAGPQGSSDFADEGYPEVGEVPYACLWTARGTLEQDPESGLYAITWRAAERITSGVRDVNLVQVAGTAGAGFVAVWQEDPLGLRPGKGLCLDGGFNGAVAHNTTDIWYTYVTWDHFDDVCLDEVDGYCTAGELSDYTLEAKPKVAVPMAVPMRLTDNEMCKANVAPDSPGYRPYCYADFDGNGTADLCADAVEWTNPGGTTLNVCKAADGRVLWGRTFATRARLEVKPYTRADGVTGAWVALIHEKSKAMGTEMPDEEEEPIDIGKDVWYHTFELNDPEIAQQGLMLNAPALNPETGGLFDVYTDEWENEYYETEIARHATLAVQGTGATLASESKTSAVLLYKQGTINQGGPADVFMRRVVLPGDFDPAVDNPFAYGNVQCVELADDGTATPADLLYSDGSNPNYVRGLCPAEGMNVSGTTIVSCDDGSSGSDCADAFPWSDDADDREYPKVTEWAQAPDNYNDPSWANPYDVSKDNQAFIDGDFVALFYSTAPNWKASTIGKEAYNLYGRRSFDGGQSWTTLPESFAHIDGVTYSGDGTQTCEDYGWGGQTEDEVCTAYGPGEFEQQRNLSRLVGTKENVLDPRHTPTGGALRTDYSNLLCYDETLGDWANCGYTAAPYPEEIRDPSAFFASYQTADNRVVDEDTGPEPLDMYYSRASNFGDDYDTVEYISSSGQLVERWDWLAQGKLVKPMDAELTATPDGSRLYAVWSQEDYNKRGNLMGVDAWFRRLFYILGNEETAR